MRLSIEGAARLGARPLARVRLLIGRRLLAAAILAAACAGLWGEGQGQAPSERPRIGLALAGGSAKGLAHVGVLRWLEEHRIPVDCAAGTSMGALVGGMHAAGYDSAEMAAFIRDIDWDSALRPDAPFAEAAFRRKEDRRDFPNRLQLGLRKGIRLPSALSPGHGVGLLLSRFAAPYHDLPSFDSLPTAFRCVAVDLGEGTEVVFDGGSLFDALRASMAIPGVFAPWRVGERVFVDGGLLNNLPTDVVKNMAAEVIIAVPLKIQTLDRRTVPTSLLGVADRSIDVVIAASERRNLLLATVVLTPDLTGLSSSDFHRAEELFERGYRAAEEKRAALTQFALGETQWEAYRGARSAKRRTTPTVAAFLELEPVSRADGRTIAAPPLPRLTPPLTVRNTETALTRITGWGRYASADYRTVEKAGGIGYRARLHEQSHGPPFLNTLLLLEGSHSDGLRFGLGGRVCFLDFTGPLSEWRSDFQVGGLNRAATEYYRRLGAGWFMAPGAFIQEQVFSVYRRGRKTASADFHEPGLGLDLGYEKGRTGELRVGWRLSRLRVSNEGGTPLFEEGRGTLNQLRLGWIWDGQDNPLVPWRGLRSATEAKWVFRSPTAERAYPQLEHRLSWAVPLSSQYVAIVVLAGGAAGRGQTPSPPFALGGPLQLTALDHNQMWGGRYYYARAALLRSLSSGSVTLLGRFSLAGVLEAGQAFSKGDVVNPYSDVALGVVGETPVGAIFLGPAYGEGGEWRFAVRLGKLF